MPAVGRVGEGRHGRGTLEAHGGLEVTFFSRDYGTLNFSFQGCELPEEASVPSQHFSFEYMKM